MDTDARAKQCKASECSVIKCILMQTVQNWIECTRLACSASLLLVVNITVLFSSSAQYCLVFLEFLSRRATFDCSAVVELVGGASDLQKSDLQKVDFHERRLRPRLDTLPSLTSPSGKF